MNVYHSIHSHLSLLSHCGMTLALKVELVCASYLQLKKKKSAGEEWIIEPSPQILACHHIITLYMYISTNIRSHISYVCVCVCVGGVFVCVCVCMRLCVTMCVVGVQLSEKLGRDGSKINCSMLFIYYNSFLFLFHKFIYSVSALHSQEETSR